MHVRCPYCHNPIEIVEQDLTLQLTCPSCGSSFSLVDGQATATFLRAKVRHLGHFELIEQIGSGAFGTVWRARDSELDRDVAIKLPRKSDLDPKELEQFLREARAAAQLRHPNIVSVHEVGRSDDTVYLVSDLVEGVTLSDWLTSQSPAAEEAARICAQVAEALHHAHEQRIVHRDLKPSNVMLDGNGDVHLMDFGLAKREAGEITMTVDGNVLGTPAYMSPEQARGEGHSVDRRSDVYSLGVILFQMLTGELPFRGTPRMLLHQVLNDEPRSPRSLNENISRDLETITTKAMAKDPARRYQTAEAMADDLENYLGGRSIVARPTGRIERGWRWTKRNRAVAALWVGLLTILLVGLSAVTWQWQQAEHQRALAAAAQDDAQRTAESERLSRLEADESKNAAEAALAAEALQRKAKQLEHERAEAHFQRARSAVDEYFTQVSESRLLDEPGLQPLRHELLEHALRYYQEISLDEADDPQARAELVAAQLRLAQIRLIMGQTDESLAALQRALKIVKGLLADGADPTTFPSWFAGWFRAPRYNRRDSALPSDPALAIALLQEACDVWERLVAAAPESTALRHDLAGCCYYYGDALFISRQEELAAEYFTRACELLEACMGEQPDDTSYRDDYALVVCDTGQVLKSNGKLEEGTALYEHACKLCPSSAALQSGLARHLAEMPGLSQEAAVRAVELARQATHASPREALYWNTYGVALYRHGDAQEAIAAFTKSIDLLNGGDGWDWFYLAMAEHRAGNTAAAQAWFKRAVEWLDEQNPRTRVRIRHLFEEAAKYLETSPASST